MAQPDRALTPRQRWLGLTIVLAAVLVDLIDVGVVVIAAPHLAADLGATPAELQWIVAGYALAFGVLLVLGGRLGDILGRRRTFLAGTVVFTVASAACALAPDTTTLIAARAAAGLGAALMVPQVLSIIQTTFTESERPRAFGAYGAVVAVGAGLAPPIGGLLLELGPEELSWRILFLINVPIGVLAVLGGARYLEESRTGDRPGLDLVGTVTVGAALLLVLFPLVTLGHGSVSPLALAGGLVGLALLALFVRTQRRREERGRPVLVPMTVFRRPGPAVGLVAVVMVWSGMSAYTLVLTLQLQDGHGLSPLTTGLVLMAWPIGVGLSANSASLPALLARIDGRQVLLGTALLTAGMALLVASLGHALATGGALGGTGDIILRLVPGLFVSGLGMGLFAPGITQKMMSWAPEEAVGGVSGTVNAVIQIAGSLGTVVAGSLFFLALPRGGTGTHPPEAADTAGLVALLYPLGGFLVAGLVAVWLHRSERHRPSPEDPDRPSPPPERRLGRSGSASAVPGRRPRRRGPSPDGG
ncbi:MFS transporter [Nocardiopsis sp. RV163]|uniref:MFS transporter n=1 Tax=Nocardiopsis sp. RV163 TaxID=1661388 RepID=UPI00069D06AF|nr:MFS transporter [Nocardiopsis sp. RV163]